MANEDVKPDYPKSDTTSRIIAAALKVHQHLGPGFEEVFYQRALELELQAEGLEYDREFCIDVFYKDIKVGSKRVDFLIEGVMVEMKAQSELLPVHYVQALSYLKASGNQVGLLLNFGSEKLGIKRLIN